MKEALFYKKLKNKTVQCQLCPRFCAIKEGERGKCGVRENQNGKLISLVYGRPCSLALDPIEKKPLYNFLPGQLALSIATAGCNLSCKHCLTPDTVIFGNDGIITMNKVFDNAANEEFTKDNCILRQPNITTITHSGKESKVIRVSKHNYNGELIRIKPYYFPEIKCTQNHEIFVFNKGKIIKKEAYKINSEDFLIAPKNIESKKISEINTKEIFEQITIKKKRAYRKVGFEIAKDILRLKQDGFTSRQIGCKFNLHPTYVRKFSSDIRKVGLKNLFNPTKKFIEKNERVKINGEKNKGVPKKIKINNGLARLLGYFCAEGCVSKYKNRPATYYLKFSIGKHEKEMKNEIIKLIENVFNIKPILKEERTAFQIIVFRSSLALLFKILCGSGAKNKKVPKFVINSDKEIIKSFLQAYIEGDGWSNKEILSTNTVSKQLALGIFLLLLKLNYLPQFYIWKPEPKKKIENRNVSQSTLYYVKLRMSRFGKELLEKDYTYQLQKGRVKFKENKDYFFVPVFKIDREKYIGPVYNLEVNPAHSYLANFVSVGNCQNWEISQAKPEEVPSMNIPPKKVIEEAKKNNVKIISYTFTEPTIFYEYVLDIAKLAKKAKIKNMIVSNGFINPEPLRQLCKHIDGANIDLKSIDDNFYKKICGARVEPVLESLKILKKEGVWIEITNLLIPTLNDNEKDIKKIINWIKENLGTKVPLHFTAFYPCYKLMNLPSTSIETLKKARKLAIKAGMKYVYTGNIPDDEGDSTFCPKCGSLLIKRRLFSIIENNLKQGRCKNCNEKIEGVWS